MDQDYSMPALMNFLDYEREKGLVNPATIASRKASVNAVLGILGPEEVQDVRGLSIDSIMARFANKRGSDFTPDSLKVYKSRVTSALNDFIDYRKDPASFKAGTSQRAPRAVKAEKINATVKTKSERAVDSLGSDMSFPVPIRPDVIVKLVGIPSDLTKREATKIANVVLALAAVHDEGTAS